MMFHTALLGLLLCQTSFGTSSQLEEGLLSETPRAKRPSTIKRGGLAALLGGAVGGVGYALVNKPWAVDEPSFHGVAMNASTEPLQLWTEGPDYGLGQCQSRSYSTWCAGEGSNYVWNAPGCRSHPWNPCRHDRGAKCHCHVSSYTSKHMYPKDSQCECKCPSGQVRRYSRYGNHLECVDPPFRGNCEKTADAGWGSCSQNSQCQVSSGNQNAQCFCEKGWTFNECRFQGQDGNGCDYDDNCDTANGYTCQPAQGYVDPVYTCQRAN